MKLNYKIKSGLLILVAGLLIAGSDIKAQFIKSVEAYSDYSVGLNRFGSPKQFINSRLKVSEADGVGGGVKVSFNLTDKYYIGVSLGYQLYTVHQDSAVEKWNWLFWDTRYKGIISSLKTDPALIGILMPNQKLDLIPLFVTFNAELKPAAGFTFNPSLGFGMAMYTRRLYLQEDWQKKFDQLNYTFGYSYRNFAPNKSGNPFAVSAGVNLGYEFLSGFRVHSEANYIQFIKTPGTAGSDDFPLERIINIKLGLTFLY